MEDNRKIFGTLIIIAGFLLLVGIVYIIFFYNFEAPVIVETPKSENKTEEKLTTTTKTEAPAIKKETIVKTPIKREFTEDDLKRMAFAFAERFGSFSNQGDYGQIKDLKIFMSEKMRAWSDNYIKEEIIKHADKSIYYGINTKAVSGKTEEFDNDVGKAKVLISVQRRESTGTANNSSSFTQNIIITYIKEGGAWKVDSAIWQTK